MPEPLSHVHSRFKPQAVCQFCGQPSTLLCDGRIYTLPSGEEIRVPASFFNGKTRSCDAQVCRQCAQKITDIHMRTSKGCRWDTRDLCPLCVKAQADWEAKHAATK